MSNRCDRAPLAVVLMLAASALASCKTVGPDFTPPPPPAVPGYLMSGDVPASQVVSLQPDAHLAGAWWKSFGSADLDRVMDQALAGNQTIAAANASLERLRDLAAVAHAAQLPQVDINAGLTGERINIASLGFSGFPNPTLGLYSIGGSVSYDTDLFGGLRRTTEAARAQAESQARQADAAYLTLTGQVTMAALQIATVRAQIAATEATVADDQQVIQMVHNAEAAGGEPASATVSGEAQLAADEALLPPLRQQLSQARHAMAQLVGEAPANWTAPDFDLASFTQPGEVPVSLPSALVRHRPDILAAEANLHIATADVGVASAALYPDIRLTANITQTAIPPANLITYAASGWTLAAGLTQPLFHGGALRAEKHAAEAEARVALAQYRGTVLNAFTQVADVMESITQDEAELAALDHAERVAAKAVKDDEAAFKLGGGPLLPVLDDERRLAMARRARVMAQGKRLADIAELYVATGADWRSAGS
ncbi:MAG TPA: efflux transporter outer membrane subunit [Caulobacteraceae bacterium]|nr:efflux transporter outer membrane subunit [Caulobacteraceae bacterium]